MLTRIDCAKLCRLSVQEIAPIWTEKVDEVRAAGTLTSFGHTSDWGANALLNRIVATIKMDLDLGLNEHARLNLDALRVFAADQRQIQNPERRAA